MQDFGGNHKRWLEEAWREDHKSGLISREELHARWFGSDVVDWLKGLLNIATTAPLIQHSVDETLTVILLDEQYSCDFSGVQVDAKLNVQAQANVQVDTSFGLTIITTLAFPPDLSNSYLYFKNSGSVSALFTIDALASASFTTGDIELFGLENFGATFSVPGILTVVSTFLLFQK
jgi:chitinase